MTKSGYATITEIRTWDERWTDDCPECGETFNLESQNAREVNHYDDGVIRCPYCDAFIPTEKFDFTPNYDIEVL